MTCVAKTMPYDYPLSEAERLQGYTLLCAHSAASSEIVIEALEALGPGEIPEQEIGVRVRAITPLAPESATACATSRILVSSAAFQKRSSAAREAGRSSATGLF